MILFGFRSLALLLLLFGELFLLGRAGGWTPDFTAILLVFCGLRLRVRAAWQILLPLALFRSALLPGGLCFHAWLLSLSYLLTLGSRRYLVPERWQFQALMGGLLTLCLSILQAWGLSDLGGDPLGRGPLSALITALVTPGLLLLLPGVYLGLPRMPQSDLPPGGVLA